MSMDRVGTQVPMRKDALRAHWHGDMNWMKFQINMLVHTYALFSSFLGMHFKLTWIMGSWAMWTLSQRAMVP